MRTCEVFGCYCKDNLQKIWDTCVTISASRDYENFTVTGLHVIGVENSVILTCNDFYM